MMHSNSVRYKSNYPQNINTPSDPPFPFPPPPHLCNSFMGCIHSTNLSPESTKAEKSRANLQKLHMNPSISFLFFLLHIPIYSNAAGELQGTYTTFKFTNKCSFTVWPGILSNAGQPPLSTTGFELPTGTSRSVQADPGWSGRHWGRTGCVFDSSGHGSCATGDCGAGKVECGGKGATRPATLAEFTLAVSKGNGLDFYDVSLVDGYNLAMVVEGGGGRCAATGCVVDLNRRCPADLKVGEGDAAGCRSACDAFRRPEFCCSGEFSSPEACRPTAYSEVFKAACPKSYSYAYDDASSTFTCGDAGEYTVTFCPDAMPSQMSSIGSPPSSPKSPGGLMLENDSWLASLATESAATQKSVALSRLLLSLSVFCSASIPFLINA